MMLQLYHALIHIVWDSTPTYITGMRWTLQLFNLWLYTSSNF